MFQPIPATILTGFLGSGKTTLLRHILNADHGYKIAVIENEFGEVAIDDELLASAGDGTTKITTLSNGCICCSSKNELSEALLALLNGIDEGSLQFDRLVIECTGMADPGPIIQTFFTDDVICERFVLDGIITLVDAVHADQQLNQFVVAQAQVGYADRILLTKTDLVSDISVLTQRLQQINMKAPIYKVIHGDIDLSVLFNIEGFTINEELLATPVSTLSFSPVVPAQQTTDVSSIVVRLDHAVELATVSDFMENLLSTYSDKLLRYKGILSIYNEPCRLIFQGVQKIYSASWDREWRDNEPRESVLVFIGVNLPEQEIREGFAKL